MFLKAFQIYGPKLGRCVGNTEGIVHLVDCKSADPLDRWIWTDYEQLLHLKTNSCLSVEVDGKVLLKSCNTPIKSQKWYCYQEKLLSRYQDGVLQLRSDNSIVMTTVDVSTENDTVRIYSNKELLCSQKGNLFKG